MNTQALYKENFVNSLNVELRREEVLEKQRQRRLQSHDIQRIPFTSSASPSNSVIKKIGTSKHKRTLKDICGIDIKVQLSEWLVWPLKDLQKWQMMPCPCGMRCLVMAHRGRTEIYHKSGRCLFSFKSKLPGDATAQTTYTVLDCIYDNKSDVLYVLDGLYFQAHDLTTCTSEFRYFWLQSQFRNLPELNERNMSNEKIFYLLTRYDGDQEEDFRAALMKFPHFTNNEPQLDGFLFYHKDAHYTYGNTPLVTWLYAFMVKDVLGYNVNDNYIKPSNYLTPMQYLTEFDSKLAKKNYKNVLYDFKKNTNRMTTTTSGLRKRPSSSSIDELLDNNEGNDDHNVDNCYDYENACDDLIFNELDECNTMN